MRKSWATNQYTNRFGLANSTVLFVWQVLAVSFALALILTKTQPKVLSPLSENPVIPTVQAQEVTPRTDVPSAIRRIAGRHAGTLLRIAQCESNLKENAWRTNRNGTVDIGVFQVNSVHFPRIPGKNREAKIQWLLNGENNVSFAYMLYLEQGTRPWRASRKCSGV